VTVNPIAVWKAIDWAFWAAVIARTTEGEEPLVESAGEAVAASDRVHPDEVDVGRVRLRRRQEADQEPGQGAVGFGDGRRRVEVVEEHPGQRAADRAAPPVVDHGDDRVEVGCGGGAQGDVWGHAA
jgi:hypothetical protein